MARRCSYAIWVNRFNRDFQTFRFSGLSSFPTIIWDPPVPFIIPIIRTDTQPRTEHDTRWTSFSDTMSSRSNTHTLITTTTTTTNTSTTTNNVQMQNITPDPIEQLHIELEEKIEPITNMYGVDSDEEAMTNEMGLWDDF